MDAKFDLILHLNFVLSTSENVLISDIVNVRTSIQIKQEHKTKNIKNYSSNIFFRLLTKKIETVKYVTQQKCWMTKVDDVTKKKSNKKLMRDYAFVRIERKKILIINYSK